MDLGKIEIIFITNSHQKGKYSIPSRFALLINFFAIYFLLAHKILGAFLIVVEV